MNISPLPTKKDILVKKIIIFYLLANSTFHILKTSAAGFAINSQLIAELLIILLSIFFIRKSGAFIDKQSRELIFAFFLYVSLATLSIVYTDATFGVEYIGLWITLIFAIALAIILNKSSFYILDISNVIIYIGIFQALLAILQVVTGNPIVPKDHAIEWIDRGLNRASGTYRDPIDLAFYLSICIFLTQFKLYNSKNIKRFKIWIYLLLVVGIVTTQSLTMFVGIFLAYVIFITFSNVRHKIRHFTILTLVFSLLLITNLEFSKKIAIFESIQNRIVAYSDPDDEARNLHMEVGLEIFKDTNYVGVGYGMYDTTAPSYVSPSTYMGRKYLATFKRMENPIMISHSLPATILAELGILGALTFVFFYYKMIKPSLSIIRKRSNIHFFNASIIMLITAKFLGYGFRLSDAFLFFILIFIIKLYKTESN